MVPKNPITIADMILVGLKKHQHPDTNDLSFLKNKRIGKYGGALVAPRFDAFVAKHKIMLVRHYSFTSMLENLLNGRIDYVGGPRTILDGYTEKMGIEDQVVSLSPPLVTAEFHMAFSKEGLRRRPELTEAYRCMLGMETGLGYHATDSAR